MVGAVSADAVTRSAFDCPAIIGKLPAHGDFLARGVEYQLREPIDRWMSAWVERARECLGDGFTDGYASAAPWLFEGRHINAVLMPSVDAVGRIFPILGICAASCQTQDIYDALIEALKQDMKADPLRERLSSIAAQDDPPPALAEWFLPEGAEQILPLPSEVLGWAEIREHFA